MTIQWGILGGGRIESIRRVRTLGLAATTRQFNELAVPGLGGVWFGKQLFLATLGVLVAERANQLGGRVTKIAVANAVEAIACWLALSDRHRAGDGRLRGSTKLVGHVDLSFQRVSRPGFYVSQPMRMATVTALPALGLVEASGSRFNSFAGKAEGLAFVEAVCEGCRPFNRSVLDHLVQWVCGDDRVNSEELRRALSPLQPLPPAALELLHARLQQGAPGEPAINRERRADALGWVMSRRRGATPVAWASRPSQIRSQAHWADLHAGALFFTARDAALAVLEELEIEIGTSERRIALCAAPAPRIQASLEALRLAARAFLDTGHSAAEARAFCRECVSASDEMVLRYLVGRDGRILRRLGDDICAGPAFKGGQHDAGTDESDPDAAPVMEDPAWPDGISQRILNLWWLGLDLDGLLDAWLMPANEEIAHG
ncbi:hypothetical protein [Azoarcus sp. KH32C]|uniref:hypothetical protein n=1 Tax=Azoarcus sp. KH32C TaxID=748247 RepID=UPI0002385EA5|nr:hypothetical protein [Azoarcus sp. KH32C]BAL23464.1 hypothetical protein AZKH_1135 [Azoarcus sp. KH32C]